MMKTTRIFAVAAVAALISLNVNATPFNPILDEFWITKNSTEIFRDSFNDGVVPPSGPDSAVNDTYFVEGSAGMAGETAGTAAQGKLTMDPSLGNAVLNPEGNTNIRTAARRLLGRNPNDTVNFLGFGDSFSVNGLFDLSSLPDVPASGFGVRIEDRGINNPNAGNDIVLLEVARGRNSGQLGIIFQDVNFETGLDIMDFVLLQPILDEYELLNTPAVQIQLSITKDVNTSVIDGFFTLFDSAGVILGATQRLLDNVGNQSGNAIGIYDGENFTRAVFQARTQVVPEPATLALMGLGLAGIGYRRHRYKKAV